MSTSFRITSPTLKPIYIYYNKTDDKIQLLKKVCLDKWYDYLLDHWLWFAPFTDKLNYEDKTKLFLDRCGTFLLSKDSRKNNILTDKVNKIINSNELPESSTSKNVTDIFYSLNEEYDLQNNKDGIHEGEQKIDLENNKLSNITKWEQKRIKKIYDKKGTLRNLKLKNVIKNTFYISKWCLVDTENVFKFNGNIYKIDNTCEQYNATIRKYDDYIKKKEIREDYDMFEIFAYIPCRKEYIPKKLNNIKKEVIINCPTLVQNAPIEFYDQDIKNISEFVSHL